MDAKHLLKPSHPSYGCDQAWFLFSLSGGEGLRLLLVEARSMWAVQTIERAVAVDGKLGPSCELLTIHRQCPSIGIRSKLVTEMEYADLMIEVADLNKIAGDPLTAMAFHESLTPRQREKADRALAEAGDEGPRPSAEAADRSVYQDVMAALVDLGYKRGQARQAMDLVGPGISKMALPDAMKAALRAASPL